MDAMRREDFFGEIMNHRDYSEEAKPSLEKKWNSTSSDSLDSDDSPYSGFDCNICLDSVQDPVVTLCGHLYCWPCIYKWLHLQSISRENQYQKPPQQCPVCKSEVSEASIVPLFGRGQSCSTKGKAPNLGILIPRRPLGPAFGFDPPQSNSTGSPLPASQYYHQDYPQSQMYYSQQGTYSSSPAISPGGTRTANLVDPLIGKILEVFYARLFSNSITDIYTYNNSYHLAGSSSPRLRRHVMEADKSLGRICFFLFCCVFVCSLVLSNILWCIAVKRILSTKIIDM